MRLKRKFKPSVDALEGRQLLSGSATPFGLTPAQIDQAYGITPLKFGKPRGTGQEIALVVVGNNPNILNDWAAFDAQYGLTNPTLHVFQVGSVPTDVPGDGNGFETDLDIQQAHQVAPGATIDLIEVGPTAENLLAGMRWAAQNTNASVVSTSYSVYGQETFPFDQTVASYLGDAANHIVVFIVPSGDNGSGLDVSNALAYSQYVISVGGTNLDVNGPNGYNIETPWSGSGGGQSQYVHKPGFQTVLPSGYVPNFRLVSDVSWDAGTGVSVYDSFDFGTSTPWASAFGTSVGAPSWAGVVSILDQGRSVLGVPSYNTYTLGSFLYQWNGTAAFHAVSGVSGGYGVQTGLGSPDVNQLSLDSTITFGYSESYYLETNSDVASAVASGGFSSGYQHFTQHGLHEGRMGTPDWYEAAYLAQNTDVANAVHNGVFASGYEHWMLHGRDEGRSNGLFFSETYYQKNNPDLAIYIQNGTFASGFAHFYQYGQDDDNTVPGRDPSAQFDGVHYLQSNPDVAQAVANHSVRSAWQHYVLYGYAEGRSL